MQKNDRRSCTGNSRHVHIRYFFVKNLIDRKQIRVLYCPTGKMLADFFTKPLQGGLFRYFRNIIMGYTSISDLLSEILKIKERVEKSDKWRKYDNELIYKFDENNPKNAFLDKEEESSKKSLNGRKRETVRFESNADSTNGYVRKGNDTINNNVRNSKEQLIESGSVNTNKPTYVDEAKRAKLTKIAHNLK